MAKLARTPERGILANGGKVILPKILDGGLERN